MPLALILLRVGCMSVHSPVVSCCPPLLLLLLLPLLEIACLLHPPCLLSSRLLLSLRAAAVEQSDGIQLFCFCLLLFPSCLLSLFRGMSGIESGKRKEHKSKKKQNNSAIAGRSAPRHYPCDFAVFPTRITSAVGRSQPFASS